MGGEELSDMSKHLDDRTAHFGLFGGLHHEGTIPIQDQSRPLRCGVKDLAVPPLKV
jgi:hypothetical protein